MAKPINNRKDILLLLLLSPGITDDRNEPITGRTRLTKMVFLFKEEVLPQFGRDIQVTEENYYRFFPWAFGPFSKELYDDLFFFILQGFVSAKPAVDSVLPEEAAEWQHWIHQGDMDDDEEDTFQQESFRLTEKGMAFAIGLDEQLNKNQKLLLREFKKRTVQVPLRALLRYVYSNHPKMTENSQIKEDVLGYYQL
jgi:uncharacterized protein YwgA